MRRSIREQPTTPVEDILANEDKRAVALGALGRIKTDLEKSWKADLTPYPTGPSNVSIVEIAEPSTPA